MFVGEVLPVAISCPVMMVEVVEWVLEAVVVDVAEARMLPTPLISIGLTYLTCLTCLAPSRLSGGGLLDGLFLTFWGGGIIGRVGERSLRFREF